MINPGLGSWIRSFLLIGMLFLLPLLIRLKVKTQTCGLLMILTMILVGVNSAFSTGGILAPGTVAFVIIPAVAYFSAGLKGALFSLILIVLSFTLIYIGEQAAWIVPFDFQGKYTIIKMMVYSVAALVVFAIGAVYEHSRKIAQDELFQISAKAALLSKMSSLGEMAAGVAHEVNNPLAIICGNLDILKAKLKSPTADPNQLQDTIEKIADSAEKIRSIVGSLRLFTGDAGLAIKAPVSLKTILDDAINLSIERFNSKFIKVEVKPFDDVKINCSHAQILQVFLNILSNSYDAIETRLMSWVMIEIVETGPNVQIVFTDSGGGIPPEIAQHIMDPFYSTKPTGKGAGLGLSVALGIARDHGGNLVYDAKSPNTRFVLTLPKLV